MESELPLKQLETVPLKERVVGELKRLIEDGALRPGDQLPSERDLSERLGVSRSTLREAVQLLGALGVLEVRHGHGTFVCADAGDEERLTDTWRSWTQRNSARVHELLEVRHGIEGLAAELAATRRDEKAISILRDTIEHMRDAEDVPALVEADLLFHATLVEASQNRALAEICEMIGDQLVPERAASWGVEGRGQRSVAEHTAICDAIERGDAQAARAAVLTHLGSVEDEVDQLVERDRP